MLAKPKRKSAWNRLFAHPFEATVNVSLQDMLYRLSSLTQPEKSVWFPTSFNIRTQKTGDNAYSFELRLLLHGQDIAITIAKCVGVVFRDSWSGKTDIRAEFIPTLYMPLCLLFFSLMSLSLLTITRGSYAWFGIFAAVATLGYGWRFQRDYRRFQIRVYEAAAKTKR